MKLIIETIVSNIDWKIFFNLYSAEKTMKKNGKHPTF